jgi:hypothetical protein
MTGWTLRLTANGACRRRLFLRQLLEQHVVLLYTARPMQGNQRFSKMRIRNSRRLSARVFVAAVLLSLAFPLQAARDKSGDEQESFAFDESLVEKWKEFEAGLPPHPDEKNLVNIPLTANDTIRLYVDPMSYSRAKDGVARVTLIVESSSGVKSIFYDGMRCETREFKTYAVGSVDRRFVPVRNAKWQAIPTPSVNAFRDHLYKKILCKDFSTARTPEEFAKAIK